MEPVFMVKNFVGLSMNLLKKELKSKIWQPRRCDSKIVTNHGNFSERMVTIEKNNTKMQV